MKTFFSIFLAIVFYSTSFTQNFDSAISKKIYDKAIVTLDVDGSIEVSIDDPEINKFLTSEKNQESLLENILSHVKSDYNLKKSSFRFWGVIGATATGTKIKYSNTGIYMSYAIPKHNPMVARVWDYSIQNTTLKDTGIKFCFAVECRAAAESRPNRHYVFAQ